MIRKLTFTFALIAVLALAAVPAFAQSASRTATRTETQLNEAYRVTNPARRGLTDVVIDVQDDQVVISATYTRRNIGPLDVSTTLVPSIQDGRLYWEATTAAVNGEAVSDAVLKQVNNAIYYSWINFWRRSAPAGHISAVSVGDDAIRITFTR